MMTSTIVNGIVSNTANPSIRTIRNITTGWQETWSFTCTDQKGNQTLTFDWTVRQMTKCESQYLILLSYPNQTIVWTDVTTKLELGELLHKPTNLNDAVLGIMFRANYQDVCPTGGCGFCDGTTPTHLQIGPSPGYILSATQNV